MVWLFPLETYFASALWSQSSWLSSSSAIMCTMHTDVLVGLHEPPDDGVSEGAGQSQAFPQSCSDLCLCCSTSCNEQEDPPEQLYHLGRGSADLHPEPSAPIFCACDWHWSLTLKVASLFLLWNLVSAEILSFKRFEASVSVEVEPSSMSQEDN